MGWQNYHMHVFRIGEPGYGPDPEGMLGHLEEADSWAANRSTSVSRSKAPLSCTTISSMNGLHRIWPDKGY